MKKKFLSVLFWGAMWGIGEATIGNVIHLWSIALPGLPGFVMFSFAFYFMNRVYLETKEPRAVFFAATIAAAIKLVDFLIPGYIAIRIINPALSILLEGLAVTSVYSYCEQKGRVFGFLEGLYAGFSWRCLWLMYMFIISLFKLPAALITDGIIVSLRFLIVESLVNAILISFLLTALKPKEVKCRAPAFTYAALAIAVLLQVFM